MPIPTRCPSCGQTAMIYEQYAGQSIPCQACGKPMLVAGMGGPGPMPGAMPMQPAPASGAPIWIIILAVAAVALLGCGGILAALLLPAVQAAREAARRAQSQNNLKQITLAIHTYHSAHRTFPPAVVRDQNGKPLYSGFVLLLPYLEQRALYDRFNKDEPWDSPANRMVSETAMSVFQDPSSAAAIPNRTDYFFVSGPGSVFENGDSHSIDEIRDGTANTILFVEVAGSRQPWAAPGAMWDASQVRAPVIGSHPQGTIVGMADGSVRTIPSHVSTEEWRAAATYRGGEPGRLGF